MAENFHQIFSSAKLQRAVEVVFTPIRFVWDTIFKETDKQQTEFIQFDKDVQTRKLAAFVSPFMEGKAVQKQGFTTNVYKPGYTKEKRITNAYNLLKRPIAQNPYAPVKSPRALAMEELGKDTTFLKDRIFRAQEKLCCDLLLTGAMVVKGEGIDLVYDFEMPAGNKWSIAGGQIAQLWSTASSDILGDIEDAADLVKKNTGRIADVTILGRNLYKSFRQNEDIRALLDNRRILAGEMNPSIVYPGVHYIGNIAEMDYYVYVEYYEDENGALQNMFNPDRAVVTSKQLRASMNYGAIQDLEFGGTIPVDIFLKSWLENDPSVQILLAQSSFLPLHAQLEGVVVIDPVTPAP